MWAGSYFHAKLAIRELDRIFKDKGVTGLEYLNQSRPDLFNNEFSLIFISKDRNNNGLIERHCVNTSIHSNIELDVAGTGLYNFVYEAADNLVRDEKSMPTERLDHWHVVETVVNGVLHSFAKEMTVGDKFFENGYGGWYDIMIHTDKFRKKPYCIKTWQRRKNGEILDLSMFTCYYYGPYLCVLRVSGESGKENYFLHVVESILSKPPDGDFFSYIKHFQKPEITIHLLNDQIYDQYPAWIDTREGQDSIDIDSNGNPVVAYNKEEVLRKLLESADRFEPMKT